MIRLGVSRVLQNYLYTLKYHMHRLNFFAANISSFPTREGLDTLVGGTEVG